MKISSLGYIGVASVRAKEWEGFGPEILGTPLWTEPADGGVYLRLDERAYRIVVHPGTRDELQYVGWEVAGPTALDEAVADLGRAGFDARPGSSDDCRRRYVEGLVSFRDPWPDRRLDLASLAAAEAELLGARDGEPPAAHDDLPLGIGPAAAHRSPLLRTAPPPGSTPPGA